MKSSILNSLLFIFGIFLIGCSCNRHKNIKNAVLFDNFPKQSKIRFQNFQQLDTSINPTSIFIGDTNIIVANTGKKLKKKFLFYNYSVQTKKLIGKYIRWGAEKNRIYSPMSYGVDENAFWIHDISLQKVLTGSFKKKVSFDSIADLKEYKMSEFSYSVQLMKGGKILKSGVFHIPQYLQVSKLETNRQINVMGNFEKPDNTLPLNTWKAAYEGFLFLRPSNDKAVISCRYADRIILFDLKRGTHKLIIGPKQFEPKFIPMNYADHAISRSNKTTFAFLGGTVTEKYIYLMYSGKKENEANFNLSNCLYVYDWNGKPVKELKLDRYVSGIAISSNNKEIYGIDVTGNKIVKSKLIM